MLDTFSLSSFTVTVLLMWGGCPVCNILFFIYLFFKSNIIGVIYNSLLNGRQNLLVSFPYEQRKSLILTGGSREHGGQLDNSNVVKILWQIQS